MLFIGIDFGTSKTVITFMKDNKFDILLDDSGSRYYPSSITFLPDHRLFANKSKPKQIRHCRTTITSFRVLMHYLNASKDELSPYFRSNKISQGKISITKTNTISVHQLIYSFVNFLSSRLMNEFSEMPRTVVYSYPDYFNAQDIAQLQQISESATANMKDKISTKISPEVSLISDLTAISFYYGITKSKQNLLFDTNTGTNNSKTVVFVDIGKSSTQLCVTDYEGLPNGRITCRKICSVSYILGGRHFDSILESFVDIEESSVKEKEKCLKEVEKSKVVLTGSDITHLKVEKDDEEFEYEIKRDDFYKSLKHYKQHLKDAIINLLEKYSLYKSTKSNNESNTYTLSNLKDKNVKIELVGGMSRVPLIKDTIENITGVLPTITMNENESVSNGCTLYAATASKLFRSDISIKEKIDFDKFLNVNGNEVDLQYTLKGVEKEFVIKGIVKENEFLPIVKNITVKGSTMLTLRLTQSNSTSTEGDNDNVEPIKMFVVTPPEDTVEELINDESKIIKYLSNTNGTSINRLGKFLFELGIGLDYAPVVKNAKFIFEYFEEYKYGEKYKNRRKLLKVDPFYRKGVLDCNYEMGYFGVFKKELKEGCLVNVINGINDIGLNEWDEIFAKEKELQDMDQSVEVKRDLRNRIEEVVYELKGKGITNERVEEIENWVLGIGHQGEVKELEEKKNEIEKIKKEHENK
eukprot:GAHX01001209.1.p1 GENE.GAHX01001209.1~~GAHX01001209.1.p1  ORF type:complete len:696 (-),score=179.88 GAHX01001209.1:29-2116(-)